MGRIGSALFTKLPTYQIFGANTNVGKTVASTILCKGFQDKGLKTLYIKPVSTGANTDDDSKHIANFLPSVTSHTLFQFSKPCSPHIAAKLDGHVPPDASIISAVNSYLTSYASTHDAALVETAGGILSPVPSGTLQADLYRPLRLPVVLVGDFHLGGIATTTSAYESLRLRGYDVALHIIFEESEYQNAGYLEKHFEDKGVKSLILRSPPEPNENKDQDQENMGDYYDEMSSLNSLRSELDRLLSDHQERIFKLDSMAERARNVIWHPFMQHKITSERDIVTIDSAFGDHFAVNSPKTTQPDSPNRLVPAFDASASWWTQGLGHGNPSLALTAAYAAGRYGHVMFASAIHEPALELAERLIEAHSNPRLSKVFYSDDGSTAVEVAIKMALRASSERYGWFGDDAKNMEVLGYKNSYHGDTIGAMDCSEPNLYNERVEWYKGRGHWFDYPVLKMKNNVYNITLPEEIMSLMSEEIPTFSTLTSVFHPDRFCPSTPLYSAYKTHIESTLTKLQEANRRFGAVIIEPILLGAGGMHFADPLFTHVLVSTIRSRPDLIHHDATSLSNLSSSAHSAETSSSTIAETDWSGLPVIFDEVFVGLSRLGPAHINTNALVHARPDIVVNAKLLTGGLLPLATTTASTAIYDAFLTPRKADALLHGHSYTAHAVGCSVAVDALRRIGEKQRVEAMVRAHEWCREPKDVGVGSVWAEGVVRRISGLPRVEGVVAIGTVLAVTVADEGGGGYASGVTEGVKARLGEVRDGGDLGGGVGEMVHARVLGNVIYFMAGLETPADTLRDVEKRVLEALQ